MAWSFRFVQRAAATHSQAEHFDRREGLAPTSADTHSCLKRGGANQSPQPACVRKQCQISHRAHRCDDGADGDGDGDGDGCNRQHLLDSPTTCAESLPVPPCVHAQSSQSRSPSQQIVFPRSGEDFIQKTHARHTQNKHHRILCCMVYSISPSSFLCFTQPRQV